MRRKKICLLDGAMGTMLQKAGLKSGEKPELFGMQHADVIAGVHRSYIEAGSDVIYANTFGVNRRKYEGCPVPVAEVIAKNIATAREAAASFPDRDVKVALDVGPIGELMEPLGTLSAGEAYECFREIVIAGEKAGADLVVFETMTDLGEVRAAVLAAKENTALPVWVTMTFEKNGRTFAGTDPEAMALTLDAMGVDAVGVNCSLGPEDLIAVVRKILSRTALPVIVKPNAGLPDPRTGSYAMGPEQFAKQMAVYPGMGIGILGGCCGTRPSFIEALRDLRESSDGFCVEDGFAPADIRNGVCSASRTVDLDGRIRVIGECINPTGKKRLQQALRERDMNYIMKCAIEQANDGAEILDINVGMPGVDEVSLMADVVRAVQSVTDLPLQIDSTKPEVIEAGVRTAVGRVIVNSVNAEEETCRRILPIVRRYGACVIGLALQKSGMPANAAERIENVKTILKYTDEYGICRRDVIIDCLALTISAQQEQAMETLRAVKYVSEEFGVHCTLGVSNISFGLPLRKYATVSFLTQAMYCGVDLPIVNPCQTEIMDAVTAFRALSCQDKSCLGYIERFANRKEQTQKAEAIGNPAPKPGESAQGSGSGSAYDGIRENKPEAGDRPAGGSSFGEDSVPYKLHQAILHGLPEEVRGQTLKLLETRTAMQLIEEHLIPALDEVGDQYEKQKLFLPQLIGAANAASAGFDLIKDMLAAADEGSVSKGGVVLATVEGDIHDIGKNIVKVVLENYGYTVIDLGRDVPPEKILQAATQYKVKLVGLSALMTTTLPAMEKTIRVLREAGNDAKIVVGGAVVTKQYADEIGADFYAKDAKETVDVARKVYSRIPFEGAGPKDEAVSITVSATDRTESDINIG